jgi:UDP-2-acetamido-3-amino-2,3-dideoxy-glucuronate N-acetyltransferase
MKTGHGTKIWHPELSTLLNCAIGERCTIHSHVWIGDNVVIGDDCKVQAFAFIPDGVEIGNHVFIGPRVTFTNDKYPPALRQDWLGTQVGDFVSIGAGAVILPGVKIGNRAMVGAGSVVTKDVPDGALVYGNPARVVQQKEEGKSLRVVARKL